MAQAASYSSQLGFQADDQSMWASGNAWQLDGRQDIPLYDWNYTFETPKAGVDLLFELHASAGLNTYSRYECWNRTTALRSWSLRRS